MRQSLPVLPEKNSGLAFSGSVEASICSVFQDKAAENSGLPSTLSDSYPPEFTAELQDKLRKNKESEASATLLVLSIDNLPMLLSGYGHALSETIVSALGRDIRTLLSPDDMLQRLQKDMLGMIVSGIDLEEMKRLAQRIHDHVENFGQQVDFGPVYLNCSILCMPLTDACTGAGAMLDQAYMTLRHEDGIIYRTFEETSPESANFRQEMGLACHLSRAIKDHRLRMAYQPIIDSKTGAITHYEALLRVTGEDGSISSAGMLIPTAERMGLIHEIDRIVLENTVRELENCPDITLAFNVSSLTTSNDIWLRRLKELVGNRPEIAARMIVEITETAVHRDIVKTAYFVAAVQAQGVLVALDDFGSGYTSFRQLKSLSVDIVKIDGAFVHDIVENSDSRFFVKTLLEFTHGFGLKAVAEFVETGETAKMLMELGVDYMQGYYFGRPDNHRRWLKEDV